jgi:myo-inositol 2-dehydrogenase / D-chiro-inositol 1-dehydrogenase
MTPLRVGLIGCGFIGRRHLENIMARRDVVLEAAVDLRAEAAEMFCQEFKGRYSTTQPDRVLEDRNIDAVLICTHHDSHAALAMAAATHGKHVLLEKPMALDVEECRQIAAAASRAGIVLTVNFKFRFAPAVLKVKELIRSPLAIHGQLAMERMPAGIWVRDPLKGGGLILATACHSLDMICWLTDSEPVRVYAEAVPQLPEQGCNVTAASATVRFANGAIASLLLAEAGENSYAGKWLHQVFAGDRSAVLYDHFRQARFSGTVLSHYVAADELRADGTFGVMEDFVNSIHSGKQPVISAVDGMRATQLAAALLNSMQTGRPETLANDLD